MIKGYQSELMNIYEKIREYEKDALNARRQEIKEKYPKIIEIENAIGKLSLKLTLTAMKRSDNMASEIENIKNNIMNLRAEKYELLVSKGYSPEYLNLHYRCSKCKDTGYIITEKCKCYKQKLIQIYYKNSEIEEATKLNNFNSFNINYYSPHRIGDEKYSPRKNMEVILDKVLHNYIPNFNTIDDNLLFYGNSGTGKTFLSHCIAKDLLDRGYLVVYKTSDELIRNLKEIRFDNNQQIEDLLVNCDLLIIDDLGAEQVTEFSVTELFTLLNKKILKKQKMIISTNLSLSDLTKTYAERITSRLFGNFTLFKVYGEDIRVKKNLSKIR